MIVLRVESRLTVYVGSPRLNQATRHWDIGTATARRVGQTLVCP